MTFKILYLYPDILDLYGDEGNIETLKYRLKKRKINCIVDTYSLFEDKPNFEDYNLIFMGGGADKEQSILQDDLLKYKNDIKKAIKKGTFILLICGGYQLFGKYYIDSSNNKINGLGIFNYYTKCFDKKKRNIGNIVIDSNIDNENYKIIGFENHGGLTYDVSNHFGKIIYKNKNNPDDYEGYMTKNVIGTYLHGPLLCKNPKLADYIIKTGLQTKYKNVKLEKIDDTLENKLRYDLLNRFLNK